MQIFYLEPLSRAMEMMKQALFRPFRLNTWMTVGFTAFLAQLLSGHSGGSNSYRTSGESWGDIVDAPYRAWHWMADNPGWVLLIVFGVIVGILIYIVLLWLSARGKFMFLDNVVQQRALVSQPWREYRSQGNSLFLWELVFSVISFLLVIGFIYNIWRGLYDLHGQNAGVSEYVLFALQWGIFFLILVAALAYITMLLDDFVVPVMYKHNISATQAWGRFLHIHWPHFGSFILYAMLRFLLWVAVAIVIIIAGLFTCCLGFLLLAIPYVSSVILLPITFTFRVFGIAFLAQFGDEFNVLPSAPAEAPDSGA